MRYVLDSDILSLLQRNHPACRAAFDAHFADELSVAVVTVEEQLSGWYTLLRKAKKREQVARAYANLAKSVAFLSHTIILPFDEPSIDQFEALRRMKLGVKSPDLRLAATAPVHSAFVVTRNLRDFLVVPGIRCEDWSQP
jgi:tRNA(fMet)-specific endonuclease VapC